MTAEQPSLFDAPPPACGAEVSWFEKFLREGKNWFTATDVLLAVGRPATEANKRWLRHLCGLSGWIISGQKGYRHIANSSADEIHHSLAWKESMIKEVALNVATVRRNAHKIFG